MKQKIIDNYILEENELFLDDGIVTNQKGEFIFDFYNSDKIFDVNIKLVVKSKLGINISKMKYNQKLGSFKMIGNGTLFIYD